MNKSNAKFLKAFVKDYFFSWQHWLQASTYVLTRYDKYGIAGGISKILSKKHVGCWQTNNTFSCGNCMVKLLQSYSMQHYLGIRFSNVIEMGQVCYCFMKHDFENHVWLCQLKCKLEARHIIIIANAWNRFYSMIYSITGLRSISDIIYWKTTRLFLFSLTIIRQKSITLLAN
jgi:hypothetical protein